MTPHPMTPIRTGPAGALPQGVVGPPGAAGAPRRGTPTAPARRWPRRRPRAASRSAWMERAWLTFKHAVRGPLNTARTPATTGNGRACSTDHHPRDRAIRPAGTGRPAAPPGPGPAGAPARVRLAAGTLAAAVPRQGPPPGLTGRGRAGPVGLLPRLRGGAPGRRPAGGRRRGGALHPA